MNSGNVIHLAFHSVRETEEGFGEPWCTPKWLIAVIERLLLDKRTFLTHGEWDMRRTEPDSYLPNRRYATLSFDDGYLDAATTVLPILKNYGIRATFYIVTSTLRGVLPFPARYKIALSNGFSHASRRGRVKEHHPPYDEFFARLIGNHESGDVMFRRLCTRLEIEEADFVKRNYLDRGAVKMLHDAGMEVGSHSDTHSMLTALSVYDATREMVTSRLALSDVVGSVHSFAWPYGMWECAHQDSLLRGLAVAGYRTGWSYSEAAAAIVQKAPGAIVRIAPEALEYVPGIPPLS